MTTLNLHHPGSHFEDGLLYVREDHEHIRNLFNKFRCGLLLGQTTLLYNLA